MLAILKIYSATNIGLIIPAILAIGAILLRYDVEDGNRVWKKPNIAGYTAIAIIIAGIILGMTIQSTNETTQANEIKLQNERYTNDSTIWAHNLKEVTELRKEESDRFDSTISKLTTQTKIQGETLEDLERVIGLQDESLKQATGGDSFGFIKFHTQILKDRSPEPNEITYSINYSFLNMGKYPLYNTNIYIWEPLRDGNKGGTWYPTIPVMDKSLDKSIFGTVVDNGKCNLFIKESKQLNSRIIEKEEKSLVFKIKIHSRNYNFEQTSKFQLIDHSSGVYSYWVEASRVFSLSSGETLYECIDEEFPRNSEGKVDYTSY